MTDQPTRVRIHGGRVTHAVTAYPGGRLRTECLYDLGMPEVAFSGQWAHHPLSADEPVTCRACQLALTRKDTDA